MNYKPEAVKAGNRDNEQMFVDESLLFSIKNGIRREENLTENRLQFYLSAAKKQEKIIETKPSFSDRFSQKNKIDTSQKITAKNATTFNIPLVNLNKTMPRTSLVKQAKLSVNDINDKTTISRAADKDAEAFFAGEATIVQSVNPFEGIVLSQEAPQSQRMNILDQIETKEDFGLK